MTEPSTEHVSIHDFLAGHREPDGRLGAGAVTLPDEVGGGGIQVGPGGDIRWGPGTLDGMLVQHHPLGHPEGLEELLRALVTFVAGEQSMISTELVEAARAHGSASTLLATRGVLLEWDTFRGRHARVYSLGSALVTQSAERGLVKLGIVLLSLFRTVEEADHQALLTLALHDEFTLYVIRALEYSRPDPVAEMFWLAQRVSGWGRVHLVERLVKAHRPTPEIMDWIVRHGFRNDVDVLYLAYIPAIHGDLPGRLLVAEQDTELLYAVSDVLSALFTEGGPVTWDIRDYPDAFIVATQFLARVAEQPANVRLLHGVTRIRSALDGDRAQWSADWTTERRADLSRRCTDLIRHPAWIEAARTALFTATTSADYFQAAAACQAAGISTISSDVDRLRADPLSPGLWSSVLEQAEDDVIEDLMELATDILPLDRIGTGPAHETGFGSGFEPHRCLWLLIPKLSDHPGVGWPLIAAALLSPVPSNRASAADILAQWTPDRWPPEAEPSLRQAAAREPDDTVRRKLQQALRVR